MVPEVLDTFGHLVRAFTNWQPFILNYCEHPVTHAYTESLNSPIRVMNRLGRGYSFGALRVRILFTECAHGHTGSVARSSSGGASLNWPWRMR